MCENNQLQKFYRSRATVGARRNLENEAMGDMRNVPHQHTIIHNQMARMGMTVSPQGYLRPQIHVEEQTVNQINAIPPSFNFGQSQQPGILAAYPHGICLTRQTTSTAICGGMPGMMGTFPNGFQMTQQMTTSTICSPMPFQKYNLSQSPSTSSGNAHWDDQPFPGRNFFMDPREHKGVPNSSRSYSRNRQFEPEAKSALEVTDAENSELQAVIDMMENRFERIEERINSLSAGAEQIKDNVEQERAEVCKADESVPEAVYIYQALLLPIVEMSLCEGLTELSDEHYQVLDSAIARIVKKIGPEWNIWSGEIDESVTLQLPAESQGAANSQDEASGGETSTAGGEQNLDEAEEVKKTIRSGMVSTEGHPDGSDQPSQTQSSKERPKKARLRSILKVFCAAHSELITPVDDDKIERNDASAREADGAEVSPDEASGGEAPIVGGEKNHSNGDKKVKKRVRFNLISSKRQEKQKSHELMIKVADHMTLALQKIEDERKKRSRKHDAKSETKSKVCQITITPAPDDDDVEKAAGVAVDAKEPEATAPSEEETEGECEDNRKTANLDKISSKGLNSKRSDKCDFLPKNARCAKSNGKKHVVRLDAIQEEDETEMDGDTPDCWESLADDGGDTLIHRPKAHSAFSFSD